MSEDHKKRLIFLFWLVVCVTILPPLFFGEARSVKDQAGGDSWRNFIFDFQTLIGGGGAILAAWYTVRQMRISDKKSDDRHQELVALQLRSDRLRVERMLKPGLSDLEDCYQEIRDVNFKVLGEMLAEEPATVADVIDQLRLECEDAIKIMSRQQFDAASDLFDGDLAYQFNNTRGLLQDVGNACHRCVSYARATNRYLIADDEEAVTRSVASLTSAFGRVVDIWEHLIIPFADMNLCLELMKKEYRIH